MMSNRSWNVIEQSVWSNWAREGQVRSQIAEMLDMQWCLPECEHSTESRGYKEGFCDW